MGKEIELKIVTPEKVIYDKRVSSVSVPTLEGEITVLPDHLPIIAAIKPGELKIKIDGKEEYFSVTKGVLEVDGKMITLLTDAAERAEAIDEQRALEAKQKAKEIMEKVKAGEEDYADAVAHLERAIARLRIAQKRKNYRPGGPGISGGKSYLEQ